MFTLDEFLTEYMKETNVTKTELARKLDVHKNTLRNWLNCDTYPDIDVVQDILTKLGFDLTVIEKGASTDNVAKVKPVAAFDKYDKVIYERGRKSAISDVNRFVSNM